MAREFTIPGQIITGPGALDLAAGTLGRLGTKALIVTDQMMIKLGNCAKVEQVLKTRGIEYSIYAGITGEPTDQMIIDGLRQYKADNCDFLIALGGGSPIDSMKAIGILAGGEVRLSEYVGKNIDVKMPPMTAIPTTAGTGSEATRFTIITDTHNNVKMLLKGNCLIPSLAVIDPQFTMTAPPHVTAATGLDALCHAVEAYTSRMAQPMSDTFALSAVKKIFQYLPTAFHNGNDTEAREQMSAATLEAGIAFNNSSVTLIHGMSRPIGALFHVAHGLSNAILLKICLEYALPGAYERFADLGRAVGAAGAEDTAKTAALKFLEAVSALTEELKIPHLKDMDISQDAFASSIEKMSHDAMESGSPQNTCREITEKEVRELYRKLWQD